MSAIKVERLKDLTPERRRDIVERSMEDIAGIFADVRDTVLAIRDRGDEVSVKHYAKLKADITSADIKATPEEYEEAFRLVDPQVVDHLKLAADNIRKFHAAQL